MGPKKVSAKNKAEKKKRMMCIELKKKIIEKYDQGVRVVDLAKQYDRSTSTICTILKQKELIKAITPAKGVKIISKQRTSIHENMEKLLMVWLTEKQLAGDTVTEAIICEKARAIYADLLQQTPGTSTGGSPGEPFKASRGWFENFKKRNGIHSVVRHGEAASADMKAAEDYLKTFAGIIVAEGYIPHQVFSCDETGLFWKKMPRRTYITAEEKRMPGHKPMKDRLTLATDAGDIEVLQEIGDAEVISTSEIKEMLEIWGKLSDFIQKKHPDKVATGHATALFNDTCLTHFRNILKRRRNWKQTKTLADESEENVAKRPKIRK